ncbi:DEP domain-containing protein 1A [Argiope bruennichi]|uniref:DEP domain-containing protein 1A n=1 Tax=Argiope bruennichi TaxID=94029 RepID=A0A8T0EF66_ARGBR|nr:DEP domain-containing protein 1A [Argiope bruennichi]
MESKEPYRATRLWNEVISAFQSGMPVKKHRRRMQTYNNCFTASEAVTWLHCYLMNNPNFGPEVTRKLSADELKLVWKKVTLSRIEKLFPSVLDNLEEKDIDGLIIKHNVSRLSKTGVVCLVDKTDDIPHWVISAMKCLANWPNASGSGSCLPNYPGFEKDVFKVVRDFFINTQVPLLTESLTPLLLKVFCHFTHHQYIDFNSAKTQYVTSMLNTSTKSHLSASDIKTSTPLTFADQNSRVQEYDREATSHGKILLDDPDLMWDYPSTVIYETDFATSNPITRVIASDNSGTNSVGSIESVSTISVCSQSNRPEDLLRSKAPLKAWSSNLYLQDEIKEHISPRKYSQLEFQDSHSLDHFSSGSNVYLCEINDLDTSNLSAKTVIEVEQDNWSDSSKRCNKQGLYYSSSAICAENSSSRINQTPQRTINQSIEKAKEYCEELKLSFQLILLLLPSVNRRQLHLLMRLINKVLKNGKFVLDVQTSMRHYLLETFLPAIVQSDQNRLLLLEVTAFLVDNCEFLFQIPKGLKQEVEDLSRSCFGRQYEEQRVSVSQEALKGLLNSILHDQNITEKERKRKMKQFKENHPDVYYLQFSKEDAAPKPKQTLLDKLAKLRI